MNDEDKLLKMFRGLDEHKIICNLYLSYMQAIDFIIDIGYDKEYEEYAQRQEQIKKGKRISMDYIKFIAKINKTQSGEN